MEKLLSCETMSHKNKEQLELQGLEVNNESLLALSMFQKAVSGNQKAVENILKLIGTKDKYDIAEQKARTKLLKSKMNDEITTDHNVNISFTEVSRDD